MSYAQRMRDCDGSKSQMIDIGVDADARMDVLEDALIAAVRWNWIGGVGHIPADDRNKIMDSVQRAQERRRTGVME